MQTFTAGQANTMYVDMVARASPNGPIIAGTVNFYLVAKSGANAGKWFKTADDSWSVVEVSAGLGTHVADGHWTCDIDAAAWIAGVHYLLYGKESTDLHIPYCEDVEVKQTGDNFPSVATAAAYAIVNSGLGFRGAVSAIPGLNQFTIPTLAGLGDGIFTDVTAPYQAFVLRDAGGLSAKPQGETRTVTAYVSGTGTFTTAAFTAPGIEANDDIIIMHPRIAELASILAGIVDIKGTGFVKDVNSLVDLVGVAPTNITVGAAVVS